MNVIFVARTSGALFTVSADSSFKNHYSALKGLIIKSFGVLLLSTLAAFSASESSSPSRKRTYAATNHDYKSSAIIEVFVPAAKVTPVPGIGVEENIKRQFKAVREIFEAQKKAIASDGNLNKAVRILMPHTIGGAPAALKSMKAVIKVELVKGTDLLEIIAISRDKTFSRDLANQLFDCYSNTQNQIGAKLPIVHEKAVEGVLIEKKKEADKPAP